MATLARILFVFFFFMPSALAQSAGDFVTAFGYGDAWTLQGAKDEAYWDLMDDREAIEDALPAHLDIDWGQIRGYEVGVTFGYAWKYAQTGTVYNPNGAACEAELDALLDIIAEAEAAMQEACTAGGGFLGNIVGCSHCNEIHDFLEHDIRRRVREAGLTLNCYDIATLFDSGSLPFDLAAHVYLGIIEVDTGDVIYVLDPWRSGTCELIPADEDPNGGDTEMEIPWGL